MEERRVFGPPGTGKTRFLADQVRKWAVEYGRDAVMVASFTRAAAAEVAGRDLPISRRAIGTLHSFAYRSIDAPEVAEPHIKEFNEAHPGWSLSLTAGQFDVDEVVERGAKTTGDTAMLRMEHYRARMVERAGWDTTTLGFAEAWDHWKADTNRIDFTDMIEIALTDVAYAPGDPAVACFDEVQDFTPLELALVRKWGQSMEIGLLAGDDDQCIYAFKGATPDAFLDPPVPDEHKRVLSQSYRLPRAIHEVSSAWVARLTRREPKHYEPRDDDGVVRRMVGTSAREPDLVVRDLLRQIEEGRTVMVLASCAYMLDPIKTMLRREGIPFHNPYRRKRGDWNPLGPRGARQRTSTDRLLAFLRTDETVWGEHARWYTYEDLRCWIEVLRTDGLLRRGVKTRLRDAPGAEKCPLEVYDTLFEEEAEIFDAISRCDLAWFADRLLGAKRRGMDFPLRVAQRRGGAALREDPKVVLGTIHSVKGAEADVVYLFPDISRGAADEWDSGPGPRRDSVIRQFYVGMTRARHELVVPDETNELSIDPYRMLRVA